MRKVQRQEGRVKIHDLVAPAKIDFSVADIALPEALQQDIITLMCSSDKHCKYLRDVIPLSAISHQIARTIVEAAHIYIDTYGKAPGDHLPNLFEGQLNRDDANARLLATYLGNIAEHRRNGFNPEFIIDSVGSFLWMQKLKTLAIGVLKALERRDLAQAEKAVRAYEAFRDQGGYLGSGVDLVRASDVKEVGIQWVWPGWIAKKELHVLAGPKGAGKSTIALGIAAAVTGGARFPDYSRMYEPGPVLIWSGEDAIDHTLRPRLRAAGAILDDVHFVRAVLREGDKRPFDPARDMPALAEAARKLKRKVALVVLDPLVAAVRGDSNNNAETRIALQPVVDLAHDLACAIIGITHVPKRSRGTDATERVIGSVAFSNLPRVVMLALPLPQPDEHGGEALLIKALTNIAKPGEAWAYRLRQVELEGSRGLPTHSQDVEWKGCREGGTAELLALADERPTRDAEKFLLGLLRDGPKRSTEVYDAGEKEGFSPRQLRTARNRLGVHDRKDGMSGGWLWSLTGRVRLPKTEE
jgi:putative DNA primase/helicase